jgi:hypothetical protein
MFRLAPLVICTPSPFKRLAGNSGAAPLFFPRAAKLNYIARLRPTLTQQNDKYFFFEPAREVLYLVIRKKSKREREREKYNRTQSHNPYTRANMRGLRSQDGADRRGRRPLRGGRLVAGRGNARPIAAGAVLALGNLAVHGGDVAAAARPRGLAARPALHLVAHG